MYDVFHLSYDEPQADSSWTVLKEKVPHARRVMGIVGIRAAHTECAQRSLTNRFFVVDADSQIIDYSVLDFIAPLGDEDFVHLWYAHNPVTGMNYGWGGIKLFPKKAFLSQKESLDMTTSHSLKIIPTVASISRFNTSAEASWRSAFRECVKLSVSSDPDSVERLATWCREGRGNYADDVLSGALAGRTYAESHRNDPVALMKINDYRWLKERFVLR